MKALILLAAITFPPAEQSWKGVARACFNIGWMLHDTKVHPERYKPGAFQIMKPKALDVCFLKKLPEE